MYIGHFSHNEHELPGLVWVCVRQTQQTAYISPPPYSLQAGIGVLTGAYRASLVMCVLQRQLSTGL